MGKQSRQADYGEPPLVPLIFRAAKLLAELMRAGIPGAAMSMTFAHAAALNFLAENAQVTSSELARHLNVTKQATSELVASLESAGIIRRAPHPADRRAYVLLLTKEGEALLAESHRRWYQIQDEWVALVGQERVAIVQDTLAAFVAAVGDPATIAAPRRGLDPGTSQGDTGNDPPPVHSQSAT